MARPGRIECEGAAYHVIARGIRKESIFYDQKDRGKFLEKLTETVEKYSLLLHCYILMDNHYHLALTTPFANLSKALHYLNSSYANWVRAKHQLIGPIFQGRYKAIVVEKDSYLLTLSAYIHLNPLKAGMVKRLQDYLWSSYPAYGGFSKPAAFLYMKDIMSYFPEKTPFKAYREFVAEQWKNYEEGLEERFEKEIVIGDEDFAERVFKLFKKKDKNLREFAKPLSAKSPGFKEVEQAFEEEFRLSSGEARSKKRGSPWRKMLIHALMRYTSLSLKEIGQALGMDYAAVSQAGRRFKGEIGEGRVKALWERLGRRLREMSNVET